MVAATNIGRVTQVIGSTFDAEFGEGYLPDIYNALKVDATVKGTHVKVTGEVQQHLGGGRVRCVALGTHRRDGAGDGRHSTPVRTGHRPRRQGDARSRVQRAGRSDRRSRPEVQ